MATWKKIISSGSKAHLLNITSSGGMQIGSLAAGSTSDSVLIRDSSGEIKYSSQVDVGSQGSSVNVFATMSIGSTNVTASSNNDVLDFIAGNNVGIVGNDGTNTITFSAVTKSISDITTILSASLTDGTHQNITINEIGGVFSITGSSDLQVSNGDTSAQNAITLTYNSSNSSLTASLTNLGTSNAVEFSDITATGNISASGYISASALHVKNNATIGGNLTLDGNFLFDGYNFETSNILNHSGSNIFGFDGPPDVLFHQFTGSVSITGSGVTLVDGIFTGDGSGLTNLSAASLPSGLLSSSEQIASDISGAYTADEVTIKKVVGEFSAKLDGVGLDNAGLATGGQIYSYIDSADTTLKTFVLNNYITQISTPANSGMVGGETEGVATLAVDIGNLPNATSLATSDFIAVLDSSNSTKKTTIAELGAIITASSAGTVTSVTAGDGLTATDSNPFTTTGTISVVGGDNITSDGTGVHLDQTLTSITSITATTGSFGHLTVTGETTVIESETLKIADNFIWLNSNENGTPSEDAGIAINRGSEPDANLYWDEDIVRWSLSLEDIADQAIAATPGAYITSVSTSIEGPNLNTGPTYGDTGYGQGNMHVDTTDGEIWIYV